MRVNQVNKARKSPGRCRHCNRAIEVGESYRWTQEYRGAKRCICSACPLRASDTTGGRLGEVYAAQENAQDDLAGKEPKSAEDLKSLLETLNEEIERLRDEYQEAADAIGEHFDGSDAISELDDFDEDEEEDETEEARDKRRAEWLEERQSAIETLINECPV